MMVAAQRNNRCGFEFWKAGNSKLGGRTFGVLDRSITESAKSSMLIIGHSIGEPGA